MSALVSPSVFVWLGSISAFASVPVASAREADAPASHSFPTRRSSDLECVPVHTIEAPGAREATGRVTTVAPTLQLKPASTGESETVTACSVVLHRKSDV